MKTLKINGRPVQVNVSEETPLLWALRENLGLTGTKYGCGVAACGACTVHVDGAAIRSCAMPVGALTGNEDIRTIEGLAKPEALHPVQQAWLELDVAQCGFCQPGMIMAVTALLDANPNPSDEDIRNEITNICRCGTYNRVLEGVHLAAKRMAKAG